MNYAFNLSYRTAPRLTDQYLILNSIDVSGPFVPLFFLILTKQVDLQKSLVELARFDYRTTLPNRRFFLKKSEVAIAEDAFSVLMILNIDHFKKVNDTWGHAVGDECLKRLNHILAKSIRSDDLVGIRDTSSQYKVGQDQLFYIQTIAAISF